MKYSHAMFTVMIIKQSKNWFNCLIEWETNRFARVMATWEWYYLFYNWHNSIPKLEIAAMSHLNKQTNKHYTIMVRNGIDNQCCHHDLMTLRHVAHNCSWKRASIGYQCLRLSTQFQTFYTIYSFCTQSILKVVFYIRNIHMLIVFKTFIAISIQFRRH